MLEDAGHLSADCAWQNTMHIRRFMCIFRDLGHAHHTNSEALAMHIGRCASIYLSIGINVRFAAMMADVGDGLL